MKKYTYNVPRGQVDPKFGAPVRGKLRGPSQAGASAKKPKPGRIPTENKPNWAKTENPINGLQRLKPRPPKAPLKYDPEKLNLSPIPRESEDSQTPTGPKFGKIGKPQPVDSYPMPTVTPDLRGKAKKPKPKPGRVRTENPINRERGAAKAGRPDLSQSIERGIQRGMKNFRVR